MEFFETCAGLTKRSGETSESWFKVIETQHGVEYDLPKTLYGLHVDFAIDNDTCEELMLHMGTEGHSVTIPPRPIRTRRSSMTRRDAQSVIVVIQSKLGNRLQDPNKKNVMMNRIEYRFSMAQLSEKPAYIEELGYFLTTRAHSAIVAQYCVDGILREQTRPEPLPVDDKPDPYIPVYQPKTGFRVIANFTNMKFKYIYYSRGDCIYKQEVSHSTLDVNYPNTLAIQNIYLDENRELVEVDDRIDGSYFNKTTTYRGKDGTLVSVNLDALIREMGLKPEPVDVSDGYMSNDEVDGYIERATAKITERVAELNELLHQEREDNENLRKDNARLRADRSTARKDMDFAMRPETEQQRHYLNMVERIFGILPISNVVEKIVLNRMVPPRKPSVLAAIGEGAKHLHPTIGLVHKVLTMFR